jgi:hypothetical protein
VTTGDRRGLAGVADGAPLADRVVRLGGDGAATGRAAGLLGLLGAEVESSGDVEGVIVEGGGGGGAGSLRDPAADWATSGAMVLTGDPDGPPLVAPGAPASAARGATLALEALTSAIGGLDVVRVDGAALLGERAAIAGLSRLGTSSPGGSCRLLAARQGWAAVNLARESDVELLPAWLELDVRGDPWAAVAERLARADGLALVERAALMGLAVATVGEGAPEGWPDRSGPGGRSPAPWRVEVGPGSVDAVVPRRPGRVVDLSALWAGPLCADLLARAGFEVVKVESTTRPDGARRGPTAFYDLLHGGHRSVVLDFASLSARESLLDLMTTADIVVESSRPRALDGLGLGPEQLWRRAPGVVWVSVTGYGRGGPSRDRVAFGDDAAAAAGLVAHGADGRPRFCGDAIADPLAGMHAAVGAVALWSSGRGGLVDVSLCAVAGSTLRSEGAGGGDHRRGARRGRGGWVLDTADGAVPVRPPRARAVRQQAAEMGAHTREVLDVRPDGGSS